jgi:hypothetical protein
VSIGFVSKFIDELPVAVVLRLKFVEIIVFEHPIGFVVRMENIARCIEP